MIVQENLQDHPGLVKTYSDAGYYVIQAVTGDMYAEAIDPISAGRTYTESNIPIDGDALPAQDALDLIFGGEQDGTV